MESKRHVYAWTDTGNLVGISYPCMGHKIGRRSGRGFDSAFAKHRNDKLKVSFYAHPASRGPDNLLFVIRRVSGSLVRIEDIDGDVYSEPMSLDEATELLNDLEG